MLLVGAVARLASAALSVNSRSDDGLLCSAVLLMVLLLRCGLTIIWNTPALLPAAAGRAQQDCHRREQQHSQQSTAAGAAVLSRPFTIIQYQY